MGCSELFRTCDFTCQDVTCPKALQISKTKESLLDSLYHPYKCVISVLPVYSQYLFPSWIMSRGWPSRSIIAQSLDIAAALRRDAISSWVVLFSNVTILFLWTLDMIFWIYRVSKYMLYVGIICSFFEGTPINLHFPLLVGRGHPQDLWYIYIIYIYIYTYCMICMVTCREPRLPCNGVIRVQFRFTIAGGCLREKEPSSILGGKQRIF